MDCEVLYELFFKMAKALGIQLIPKYLEKQLN